MPMASHMRDSVSAVTVTDLLPDLAGDSAHDPAALMRRIGTLVRDARRHRGLTQVQLAERLGTPQGQRPGRLGPRQGAVARIEQGGQNLTLELLGRLSGALGSKLFSLGPG